MTAGEVGLVVALAGFIIGGLLLPGAVIGGGIARKRPGVTAIGCVVPIVLALVAGAILSSVQLTGT